MKTYEFGLLQTAAFRALKGHTLNLLKKYSITSYEWAILGVLYENKEGCLSSTLAKKLKVSKPFITKAVKKLVDKKYIEKVVDATSDKRTVRLQLTSTGQKLVPEIEQYLRSETKHVFKNISKVKLLIYIQILKKISKTFEDEIDDAPIIS